MNSSSSSHYNQKQIQMLLREIYTDKYIVED